MNSEEGQGAHTNETVEKRKGTALRAAVTVEGVAFLKLASDNGDNQRSLGAAYRKMSQSESHKHKHVY